MSANFKKCLVSATLYCEFKNYRANSIDQDEVAHYEPSHLDLRCL